MGRLKTEVLKQLRIDNNETQAQLAEKLGIGRTNYTKIENGIHDPDTDLIAKIADHFKISIDQLIKRDIDIEKILEINATVTELKSIDTLPDDNTEFADIDLSEKEMEILFKLRALNEKGAEKVSAYLDDLLENPSNIRNDDTVKNEGVS